MKNFEHPYVVGLISKSAVGVSALELKKKFSAAFARKRLPYAYLILKVEPRYLKNLIPCMKSMDVVGVHISKDYEKKVLKMVDRLDRTSKDAKKVNLIAKKGGRFVGYFLADDLVERSIKLWCNNRRHR